MPTRPRVVGGDANVSFANQSGAISIDVFSQGLDGVLSANVLGIVQSDGLTAIADKLAKYLSSLQAHGQPVKYQLAPLPLMPLDDISDIRMIQALTDLKSKYDAGFARFSNVRLCYHPAPIHAEWCSASHRLTPLSLIFRCRYRPISTSLQVPTRFVVRRPNTANAKPHMMCFRRYRFRFVSSLRLSRLL